MAHEAKNFFAESGEKPAHVSGPEQKPELLEVQDRLQAIIRAISGKSDLEVTTKVEPRLLFGMARAGKDARKEWFRYAEYDPKTRKQKREFVHIPEYIFETSENVAKGKAAHEAGHVVISRDGEFIPDEVMQELGFHELIAAIEERPTDQVVRERFSGAGVWVDEARADNVREGEKVIRTKTKEELGYIPKSAQLAALCVHAPHYERVIGHMPEYIAEEVLEVYERIKSDVEKIEHTLPEEGASEDEVIKKAQERYKIIYRKVWPETKKLVGQDVEKENLRQMLEEALRKQAGEGAGGGKEGKNIPGSLDDLMERLGQELAEELESILESALEEMSKKVEEKKREALRGAGKKEGGETEEQGEKGAGALHGEPAVKKGEEPSVPIPMDQLSEKLMEALKKAFDRLPKEKKERIKELARRTLEAVEDALVEELSGKLEESPAETHKEFRARAEEAKKQEEEKKQKEARRKTEKERIERELAEIARKQEVASGPGSIYDKAYEEVRELDERLYRRLEEIFTPNIKREMRLRSSGSKINLPAVFRWEAGRGAGAPSIDNRIFESLHLPEKKDYAFLLLNDLSESMRGVKIWQDFKAKVLLSEVLNRLGIQFEVLGFSDDVSEFKMFHEDLDDGIRRKMAGLAKFINSTATDIALMAASRDLGRITAKEKFLITLTDGKPGSWNATLAVIKNLMKQGGQKLIGIGLGPDTEFVEKLFPVSIANADIKVLAETLGALLEDMIVNPQKYTFEAQKEKLEGKK